MRPSAAFLLLVCAGCASSRSAAPPPTASDTATLEVIQAGQRLFDGMAARDTTALHALFHPEGRVIGIRPDGAVRAQGATAWIRGVGGGGEVLRERIWDPRVEISGDLATLWAPYDFHVGERFSHCGIDAFQFVREAGRWRLLVASFTMETEGCGEAGGSHR